MKQYIENEKGTKWNMISNLLRNENYKVAHMWKRTLD